MVSGFLLLAGIVLVVVLGIIYYYVSTKDEP